MYPIVLSTTLNGSSQGFKLLLWKTIVFGMRKANGRYCINSMNMHPFFYVLIPHIFVVKQQGKNRE